MPPYRSTSGATIFPTMRPSGVSNEGGGATSPPRLEAVMPSTPKLKLESDSKDSSDDAHVDEDEESSSDSRDSWDGGDSMIGRAEARLGLV
mmetsp:Transcript_17162/g.36881  ORF Transcript_17162/g.36881 Transcript_17162/m.36881 type:complete len:91 (-) Transcript_17162:132-404(-)